MTTAWSAQEWVSPGSRWYYSVRFIPPEPRPAILALHALQQTLTAIPGTCSEPQVALAKLGWWQQQLRTLLEAPSKPLEHPLLQTLQPYRVRLAQAPEAWQALLAAVQLELSAAPFSDVSTLQHYHRQTGGNLAGLAGLLVDVEATAIWPALQDLGQALMRFELLYNIGRHTRQGRPYLAEEQCRPFNLLPDELHRTASTEAARALLATELTACRDALREALEAFPATARYRQHWLIIQAELALTVLTEIARDGHQLLNHQVDIPPLRKLWIAWRVHRRERRRHRA